MDGPDPDVLRPRDRDSHDLDVQLTRYSIVDSMLLSLAGFPGDTSTALPSTFDPNLPPTTSSRDLSNHLHSHPDNDPFTLSTPATSRESIHAPRRSRAHTYSSSHSDIDNSIDDTASKYSAYHNGSARINAPTPRRQNTGDRPRETLSFPPALPDSDDAQYEMVLRSRGSRGPGALNTAYSEAAGARSTYANSGGENWTQMAHRAASFDHGSVYDGGLRQTTKRANRPPPLHSAVPPEADYDDVDAAPTPSVPGGPRRQEAVSASMGSHPVTPRKGPSRQNSVKSSRTLKKTKSNALPQINGSQDATIRDQARQFVAATNNLRSGQTTGNAVPSAAPSPTVGGHRKAHASPITQSAPKERQGFFRRVFGGGSKHQGSDETSTQHKSATPNSTLERPKTQPSQRQSSDQFRSSSRPPTQGGNISSRNDAQSSHHTLRKSSSSFFRRRKKSFGELAGEAIPPVPSLPPAQPQMAQHAAAPAPAINSINIGIRASTDDHSLRNVMAPYLSGNESRLDAYGNVVQQTTEAPADRGLASGKKGAMGGTQDLRPKASGQLTSRGSIHGPNGEKVLDGTDGSLRPTPTRRVNSEGPAVARGLSIEVDEMVLMGNLPANANTDESGTSLDSHAATAPMPSRPAPVPIVPSTLQPPRTTSSRERLSLSLRSSTGDRPVLSPISDRSFLTADAMRTPSEGIRSVRSNPSIHSTLEGSDHDDEYLIAQATTIKRVTSQRGNGRVWLHPTDSEEDVRERAGVPLPLETTSSDHPSLEGDEPDVFSSATSLPVVQVDSKEIDDDDAGDDADMGNNISNQHLERARQIFDGDESLVPKSSAAAWLGSKDATHARVREAYMRLYDWTGENVLSAFRELCTRLIVRAESQELDRVIDGFSSRWCECNPNHGFKDKDVIHTLAFSILMLNTDLHVADMDTKMTRSQFVRNTLPTIRAMANEVMESTDTVRRSSKSERGAIPLDVPSTPNTPLFDRPSLDLVGTNRNRFSRLPRPNHDNEASHDGSDGCNLLVNAPCEGSMKNWESQVEAVLKDFYSSIRQQRLPLHGAPANPAEERSRQQSSATLSVVTSALRRTPSVLSKAPSENASYRGRADQMRSATGRFTSKSRNRPRMYPSSTFTFGSSRTSLDDQSMWSPAASTFTKHSLGKTQTSMSVESLGTWSRGASVTAPIGFANAVSRKMIREETGSDNVFSSSDSGDLEGRAIPLLENEDLELYGPPWAKEGSLTHVLFTGPNGKRSKGGRPIEIFAVVAKGHMRLFKFAQGSSANKSALRHFRHHKNKTSGSAGAGTVVGGGNWAENAEELESFVLRQTWAGSDGKNKSNKDKLTWYLHLPTGEVHAFGVSSKELAEEWTWTVNYWSARLSKEPLMGGVSNIEYGWGENLLHPSQQSSRPESSAATISSVSVHGTGSRPPSSVGRSSMDQGNYAARSRLPGDRATLGEWRPPAYSVMSSQLMEVDQKSALEAYLHSLDEEFTKHSDMRPLMATAFSPRHPNAAKALTNWTRKANYLTGENVKYKTYISALERAGKKKVEIDREKEQRAEEDREWRNKARSKENIDPAGDGFETNIPDVDPVHGDLERDMERA